MYSVVLAALLTAGASAPDHGWKSCHGCYGAAYGGCYGVCYGGWGGCYGGCSGCWGCGGCYGGCSGCWGCNGCFGGASCYGCYGSWSCFGGCCGTWSSAYGGCSGYSSCYGYSGSMSSCHGCAGGWAPASGGCAGFSSNAPVVEHGHHHHAAPVMNHAAPVLPQPTNGEVKAERMPATVVIKAASAVKISVNGQETKRNNEVESFSTPKLTPGKTYAYEVVAEIKHEGKVYTSNKRVLVKAGQQSEVDFGDMSAVIAEAQAQVARITVIMPRGGKLFVDGQEQKTKGQEQTFDTPKLAKGKSYFYVIKVEVPAGKDVDARTERVNVQAGKEVTVDFRNQFVAQR